MAETVNPQWITAAEAAAILECRVASIPNLVRKGRIKARKPVFRHRIDHASVLKLAKELNEFVPAKGA